MRAMVVCRSRAAPENEGKRFFFSMRPAAASGADEMLLPITSSSLRTDALREVHV